MASVSLKGPYRLTKDAITEAVTERSAGSFVLGHMDPDGEFTPRYVGRSDHDVRDELELHLRLRHEVDAFIFRYASAPWQAFEQQCQDFHECSRCETLENKGHPSRPSHTEWTCPICGTDFLTTH